MNKKGRPIKNIIGQKFNRLLVLEFVEVISHKSIWKCRCDCGNIKNISGADLKSGNTKSCGCYLKENAGKQTITHGETRKTNYTGTYKSWRSMKARCTNPKNNQYHNYGARGITFCDRWNKYENFLEDMGERPDGYSLERNDPNGNYEPENCCWIPLNKQSRNTRRTVWIIIDGKKMIQTDAAKYLNKDKSTIYEWRKYPHKIPKDLNITFLPT
jgi:hypothetical protein